MNIDLLFTANGEAGLISSQNFVQKAIGVILDTESGLLTIEYADMDFIELNIPVESEFFATLDACPQIHIGAVKDGKIAQAYQVPLMYLDDPYRMEALKNQEKPKNPLEAFSYFIKACMFGQPVHRDDLADEASSGCILGDAVPASLQFAPHLARQQSMERAQKAAPKGPGPSGPGLGGGGGSGGATSGGTSGTGRITRGGSGNNSKED